MKIELVDDEWRGDRPTPPQTAEPQTEIEAVSAIRDGKRIDSKIFLDTVKKRCLRLLLREVAKKATDSLAQAYWLGVSETCLRKWQRVIKNADSGKYPAP